MMATEAKTSIQKKLNWDYAKEIGKVVGYASLGLLLIIGTVAAIQSIRERLRKLRLEADNA